ncbi:hypothetical protein Tco_1268515 [Tanacetum coccineum]
MVDTEKKSTMKRFATNEQADYYSGITSITVNGKNAYELKGKFLDDLHNNALVELMGKKRSSISNTSLELSTQSIYAM